VDIQHFNVSHLNNWPPQYYAPHYYATDLWSKVDIQHFNVSSCQQLASSMLCTSLLCSWSLVPRELFNILMCPLANNWPPPVLYLTTMQLIFGWVDFNILMCPLANNWPPQYYAPHYYATDLWSKVDVQHFNVSSCQQLASSILCLTTMADLWSKVDIQHLMCPLANNWPLSTMHLTTMQLIFGPRWIFNILVSCQQLASSILCSLLCSWSFGPRWMFNI
jgi:hypothetical protein